MSMLAYSPVLSLIDSQVAAYKIYTIRNPFTNEIFYVGQTIQDLETRLSGHINSGEDTDKCKMIADIISKNDRPIIELVETIHGTCYVDKITTNEREFYWIKYFKSIGCNLLNISGIKTRPESREYQNYLASIKRGETSWHYYYCGKTAGGYKVYDEKRLKADGFSFPRTIQSEPVDYSPESYNPWNNERFLKKIGNLKNSYDSLSYDPIYKDEDPEYYEQSGC